jgi:alkylation response protein AidB-like acyl-CoA dehydrogenase
VGAAIWLRQFVLRARTAAVRRGCYCAEHYRATCYRTDELMASLSGETSSTTPSDEVRARMRELSSQFFADAGEVDSAATLPAEHVNALASTGLYGIFAPVAKDGLGLDYAGTCAVVEELASSCLATTFVWVQHFRFLGAMVDPTSPAKLRDAYLAGAVRGDVKGGVALTGLLPGPARLSARPAAGGWQVDGEAPWVTGWGMVDLVFVVARGPDETVVSLLLDATPQPGLTVEPLRLSAANASATVRLGFDGVLVGGDRLVSQQPYEVARHQSERLRLNGSFALGVTKRCCALLGPSPLDDELVDRRSQLDSADEAAMPLARARASELAVRAAHALAVHRGARSAIAGDVAERLSREAAFLLVFGSRAGIKDALLQSFTASGAT